MKRNSSLCFLVNIDRVLFNAAPPRARCPRREPARLNIAQTVNERYTFVLRSASPLLVGWENECTSMGCGIGGKPDSGKPAPFVLYARDGHAQGAKSLGF